MLLSSHGAELGGKHSQSWSRAKSSGSSSAVGALKSPFANKDLLRVCEGSLGREKVITWQQLLVTCFPGNLAALPAGIWIEVKLLEASMPLAPWAFSFSPSARCGRAQHERQYPAPVQAAEGSCWPQRQALPRSAVCLEYRCLLCWTGGVGCGQATLVSSPGFATRQDLGS